MRAVLQISVFTFALALSGCASSSMSKTAGGLEANGFVSPSSEDGKAVAGFMGGGLISTSVGSGISRSVKMQALEAEYRALETGQTGEAFAWGNDNGGTSGQVVAAQPYRVGSQNCRQYTQIVDAAGREKTARGTACRNGDGSWTLLN